MPKGIIFLADGMADIPLDELGGKTPLEAVDTPAMDAIAASGASGTFIGSGTVTGATTAMAAIASAPGLLALCTTNQCTWNADVVSANTVEVQVTLPNIGPTWGNIAFNIVVFP